MHASHRRVSRALVTICASIATTSVITAAPSAAAPDVDDARDRLETAQQQRDKTKAADRSVTKKFVRTGARLQDTRSQLKVHEVALAELEADMASTEEDQLGLERLAQASSVVRAEDPREALAEAQAEAAETDLAPRSAELLESKIATLRDRETTLEGRVAELRSKARKSGATLKRLRSRVGNAAAALEEAREAARAARPTRSAAPRSTPQAAPEVQASGGAGAAVAYALAQVGDSYVYGAAGPSSFDCSGLTMAAWSQGGVSLPHSSGAQMGSGTPVSTSALQPGDLVFYYSPVSHVGIYVGNGQIVHAANPSTDVQQAPVFSMPVSGAVRPG